MGNTDGIKGSDGYFWNLWHVVQFSIRYVSCLLRLGHHIEFLDLSLHLEMPIWSLCSVSRMSKRNGSGMIILLPCISSSCMVISPATEMWFKHTRCVFHFCLASNVFNTQLVVDNSHFCFNILLSHLCIYVSVAGKFWQTKLTYASTSRWCSSSCILEVDISSLDRCQ